MFIMSWILYTLCHQSLELKASGRITNNLKRRECELPDFSTIPTEVNENFVGPVPLKIRPII